VWLAWPPSSIRVGINGRLEPRSLRSVCYRDGVGGWLFGWCGDVAGCGVMQPLRDTPHVDQGVGHEIVYRNTRNTNRRRYDRIKRIKNGTTHGLTLRRSSVLDWSIQGTSERRTQSGKNTLNESVD
jgi:hypothetical protein